MSKIRARFGHVSLLLASGVWASAAVFNVRDYGAAGDGVRKDTAAIERAVEACAGAGGGTVVLPPGRYLSGTIALESRVTLEIDAGATLLASEDPGDYPSTPSVWGDGSQVIEPLIYAVGARDLAITGSGTIDGQGAVWWRGIELAHPRHGRRGAVTPEEKADVARIARGRPQLIRLVRCRDVLIERLTLRDSPEWNIHPLLCENVRVDGVSIYGAPGSHNTDGIDPESCRDVQILGCRIDTGDDCVTLKSGLDQWGRRMARPDEDITIADCVMYRGHGGVTIGSEMSGGVRNVTVTNCVFHGTDNGIRIKSQRGRGGVVEGLVASNIVMQDVPVPFVITTFYSGRDRPGDLRKVDEGTPRYRDFHFMNITARGARIAGAITGLREMPIEDVTFSGVTIRAETGFACANARDVVFCQTDIDTAGGPALLLRNSSRIDAGGLRTLAPHPGVPLVRDDTPASR